MENEYKSWLWEKLAEKTVKNLKKHQFDAHFFQKSDEALKFIMDSVSGFESFGFGGSDTTHSLNIPNELEKNGKTVYDHNKKGLSPEQNVDFRKKQSSCDCFFCSANAISATGEIVNVDGVGNRTNAMSFGPKKVIIISGMNKVTHDLESAMNRIKQVAGPMRAKSLGMETPCAETGICNDCNVPMRICRITTILHHKPMMTDVSVVLINEELGY
jgi:hypothetical protein